MIRDRRTLLGLLAVAIGGVALLPFLLRAADPELESRRQRVAAMSPAEREHLERNFEAFQSLSAEDVQRLREFEAALAADVANNHGRAASALRVYGQWIKTLTPSERDALREETDPVKRLALVQTLVDAQRTERIETRMGDRAEEFLGPIPDISPDDLKAMLAVIDSKAGLLLSRQSELDGYEGMDRALKTFEILARNDKTIRDVVNDTALRQLLAVISDESTRTALETIPESNRPMAESMARRIKLGLALYKAIEAELERVHRRRETSTENLTAFFEKLPLDEQDQLLTLTPDQFRQQLLGRYVETQWSQNRINLTLVRQFFRTPRPPGERPPGDPRRRDTRG